MLACVLAGFAAVVHFAVRVVLLTGIDRDLQDHADTVLAHEELIGAHTLRQTILAHAGKSSKTREEFHQQIIVRSGSPHPMAALSLTSPDSAAAARSHMMIVRMVGTSDGKHAVTVTDKGDGSVLPAGVNTADVPPMPGRIGFATITLKGRTWRTLVRHVTPKPGSQEVVQVAFPLDEMLRLLHGLDLALLGLIPLVLLVAGTGGAFLTRRAFQPIEELASAAAAIEASDLSRRLPQEGGDELSHLARTFNGMLSRLDIAFAGMRRSMERQKRFTADASHELRTPLTTVRAYAEWAMKRPRTVDEYHEALQKIVTSVDQMNGLIEDLLLLARTESGTGTADGAAIDVCALCRASAESVAMTRSDIQIRLVFESEPLTAWGNARHCERILANLLDNAMRFTPEGGSIQLEARREGGLIRVTIQDSGPGIRPEDLPYVCDRFFQSDASRSQRGAGLGLAICKTLAEAQGGSLTVESPPGTGARVLFSLPLPSRN
jgi:signal transduction histidine kinase